MKKVMKTNFRFSKGLQAVGAFNNSSKNTDCMAVLPGERVESPNKRKRKKTKVKSKGKRKKR